MTRYEKAKYLKFTHQVRCIDSSNSQGMLENGRVYTANKTYIPWIGKIFLEISDHFWPDERFMQVLSLHKEIQMKTFMCPKCGLVCDISEWDDMLLDGVVVRKFNIQCWNHQIPLYSRDFNCGDHVPVQSVINSMKHLGENQNG